ncbi:MAG: zeta toxin, partial [Muribaculaceae bacterium]|nr:zeta toxin [Muribaculaceae bacterium]
RVAARVAEGGHDIPKTVIHSRYWLGIQNLFSIFAPIVDRWSLYDNSGIIQPIVERNIVRDKLKLLQITNSCPKKTK